jgi:hypothetical protein
MFAVLPRTLKFEDIKKTRLGHSLVEFFGLFSKKVSLRSEGFK